MSSRIFHGCQRTYSTKVLQLVSISIAGGSSWGGAHTSYLLISAISSSICSTTGAAEFWGSASPLSAVETAKERREVMDGRRAADGVRTEKDVVRERLMVGAACAGSQRREAAHAQVRGQRVTSSVS